MSEKDRERERQAKQLFASRKVLRMSEEPALQGSVS